MYSNQCENLFYDFFYFFFTLFSNFKKLQKIIQLLLNNDNILQVVLVIKLYKYKFYEESRFLSRLFELNFNLQLKSYIIFL